MKSRAVASAKCWAYHLRQHARQVVDELQRQQRDREIDRLRRQLQRIAVDLRQLNGGKRRHLTAQRAAQLIARRRQIDTGVKCAFHRAETLHCIIDDAIEQERRRVELVRARPPHAQQSAIEQDGCSSAVGGRHGAGGTPNIWRWQPLGFSLLEPLRQRR
jgi:hypothetical protein